MRLTNYRKIDGRWYADLGTLTVSLGDDDETVGRILRDEQRARDRIDAAIERGDWQRALTLLRRMRSLLRSK